MVINYAPPLYVFPAGEALTPLHDHTHRDKVTHTQTSGPAALEDEPTGPLLVLAGIVGLTYALSRIEREEPPVVTQTVEPMDEPERPPEEASA
jgi:hypothetical protein